MNTTKFNNLIRYPIPEKTPDWFKFRYFGLTKAEASKYQAPAFEIGIGASGAGNVLRLTYKYDVLLKLFNQMIKEDSINYNYDNRVMFFGRVNEDLVGKLWQCYDSTKEGYIDNWKKWQELQTKEYLFEYKSDKYDFEEYKQWEEVKRKQDISNVLFRTYQKVPYYLVNPKYPRLYCSLDGWADKGSVNLITGEIEMEGFPVESKTISLDRARSLGTNNGFPISICGIEIENHNEGNSNIPLSYLAQIQQQMLITESKYAELGVLIGGNDFQVNKYTLSKEFCDYLVQEIDIFCEKVLTARKAINIKKSTNDQKTIEQSNSIILQCEPGGVNEEKYQQYISEIYYADKESMKGTVDDKKLAYESEMIRNYIKALTNKKIIIANKMSQKCKDNKVEQILLGDAGRIEWRFANKRSKTRTSTIRIKKDYQPDMILIENLIDKLPTSY